MIRNTNNFYVFNFQLIIQKIYSMNQKSSKLTIQQITPNIGEFSLSFEIDDIVINDKKQAICRLVDQTGIINATFNRFVNKLQKGYSYTMSSLKAVLVDSYLHIQMTEQTIITKQPNLIAFKDKCNDISKIKFDSSSKIQNSLNQKSQEKKKHKPSQNAKTEQKLIPFSKQEAQEQLKIKQKFYNALQNHNQGHKSKAKQKPNSYKQKNDQKSRKVQQNNILSKYQQTKQQKYEKKAKYTQKETQQKTQDKKIKQNNHKSKIKDKNKTQDKQSQTINNSKKPDYKQKKMKFKQKNQKLYIQLAEAHKYIGQTINVKVWVTDKLKKDKRHNQTQFLIADSSGSLWLVLKTTNLQQKQYYEIGNVEVCKQLKYIYLKQLQNTQAVRAQQSLAYNLRNVNTL